MDWNTWLTLIGAVIGMIAAVAAAIISSHTQHKVAVYSAAQEVALKEHEIKLSSLHSDRVRVVIRIFHELLDLEQLMHHYLRKLNYAATQDIKEQAYIEMYETLNRSHEFFYRHKFYFDEATCDKVNKVFGALHNIEQGVYGLQYSSITRFGPDYSKEERSKMGADILKAHEQMRNDLKIALHELQDEIRHLIGVRSPRKPS
jgi:hypothetical protein